MIDSAFWGRLRERAKAVDIAKKIKALITGDEEYQAALKYIEDHIQKTLLPSEEFVLDVMSLAVEEYERRNHPLGEATPGEVLAHLTDARDLSFQDLSIFLDGQISSARLTALACGEKRFTEEEAEKIAKFFNVNAELFLEEGA